MIGIILAAGKGKRLRAVWDLPKVLLPVFGKTLLERHVEGLRKMGAEKIIAVVQYRKEDIINYAEKKHLDIEFVEGNPEDTKYGRSLKQALKSIDIHDEIVYVMGDHFIDYDTVIPELEQIKSTDADFVLIGNSIPQVVDPMSASRVLLNKDGTIKHTGKDITSYDVLDTGLFYMRASAIPDVLSIDGQFDTTHIVDTLKSNDKIAKAVDIPDMVWFGCNTPEEVLMGILGLERRKLGL